MELLHPARQRRFAQHLGRLGRLGRFLRVQGRHGNMQHTAPLVFEDLAYQEPTTLLIGTCKEAIIVEALMESRPGDGERFPLCYRDFLRNSKRRIRLKIDVVAADPTDFPRVVDGVAQIEFGIGETTRLYREKLRFLRGERRRDKLNESPPDVRRRLMLRLSGGHFVEGSPGFLPESIALLLGYGAD